MKKVYIAHPYGGKEENKDYVENIVLALTKKYPNILFISPIHALGYLYTAVDYDKGMEYCYSLLNGCDELLLCEGWGDSVGCYREEVFATANDIPIKYCVYIGDNEYTICPVSLTVPCTMCMHHRNNKCTVMDSMYDEKENTRKSFFRVKGICTENTECFTNSGFDFNKEYLINEIRENGSIAIKIDREKGPATIYVFALGDYERIDNNDKRSIR